MATLWVQTEVNRFNWFSSRRRCLFRWGPRRPRLASSPPHLPGKWLKTYIFIKYFTYFFIMSDCTSDCYVWSSLSSCLFICVSLSAPSSNEVPIWWNELNLIWTDLNYREIQKKTFRQINKTLKYNIVVTDKLAWCKFWQLHVVYATRFPWYCQWLAMILLKVLKLSLRHK